MSFSCLISLFQDFKGSPSMDPPGQLTHGDFPWCRPWGYGFSSGTRNCTVALKVDSLNWLAGGRCAPRYGCWKGWNSGFIPQGYFFGYFKTFFHAGKEGVTVNQYVFSGFWNSFNGRSSSWWKVFQKLRVFETTVSNKECKMQMYTTGIFISSNGTSPFLMGETSSNGCFSIAMLVFGV